MTEPNSFELFMRNYQDMVFTTAFRLLGNETDAEDIGQEVFLKAYRDFDTLRDNRSAGGWLKTVTRNLCLNHLSRYRARWRFFSEIFSGEHGEDEREAEFASPVEFSQQIEDADRRRLLHNALMKLPSSQRVPLVLYHYEGLSYEEISKSLKISLSKAKTDIHRGREALREKLKRIRGELESDGFPARRPSDFGRSGEQCDTRAFLSFARNELRA
jgi:RNA polymerase sigma-70 factor, ECF subfamily